MKQIYILLACLALFVPFIHAQKVNDVTGFVYDNKDGEALIGASVHLKGRTTGSVTNTSGYFVLTNIPFGKYTLQVTYIGYKPLSVDIEVNSNEFKTLQLKMTGQALVTKEVMVVADSVRTIDRLYEKPISKIDLSSKQVNQIPRVIEADLLRALQTLPGVTALSDFSSALYIRGGTPDQNLYLVDGTDVYNPEHAFGIFSTFNTNAIKKVELSKGGFSAEYGGRLSSVLNVTNLDGNRNQVEGCANISLLSASATIQAPLGSFGSISGSFRRTYIDQTYAKWNTDIPDYYFYDGNLKAYFDLGEKDKLTLSYFTSKDNLDFKEDKSKPSSFGFYYFWGNKTSSLNWKHVFGSRIFSNFWATYSYFNSDFNMEQVNFREKNNIHDFSLKGALEYYLADDFDIRFGFEHKFLGGALMQEFDNGNADVAKERTHSVAYISSNYKPWDALSIEAGLRYNYFNSDVDYHNFEPRFSAKLRLTESSNLKFATGLFHQYLNRIPRLFFTSIWTTSDEYVGVSSSQHYIFGYQKAIDEVYEFEVETYYKTYKNIYQYNQLAFVEIEPSGYKDGKPYYTSTKGLFNSGDGESYGIELMIRKDLGAINGWIAYSLSRTNYTFTDINKGQEFIPRHDRTSILNAVVNVDWKGFLAEMKGTEVPENENKWLFTFNFVYSTGQPITVPSSAYFLNDLPDWNQIRGGGEDIPGYSLYPSGIDKYRLPAYIRMDASVTWEIKMNGWILAPYLQVFNIGNRKNVWFIKYKSDLQNGQITQTIDKVNMLPMLPSIGVNIKF
ncbi:MAG: TonB-dependent receptor [Ignavibacteria bacterium]|nr:TonB-dependent receptor [Ignavibacteria bacterium]